MSGQFRIGVFGHKKAQVFSSRDTVASPRLWFSLLVAIAAEIYGGAWELAYMAALIVSVKYKNVCLSLRAGFMLSWTKAWIML